MNTPEFYLSFLGLTVFSVLGTWSVIFFRKISKMRFWQFLCSVGVAAFSFLLLNKIILSALSPGESMGVLLVPLATALFTVLIFHVLSKLFVPSTAWEESILIFSIMLIFFLVGFLISHVNEILYVADLLRK